MAIALNAVLAVASLIAQAFVNVLTHHGQSRPTSLYLITIAASGERKTTADTEAMRPITIFEAQLAAAHAIANERYRIKITAWESAEKRIRNDRSLSKEAMERELEVLGPAPTPPPAPLLTCPDATFEGLWLLLLTNLGFGGVFSSEGGQFTGGHVMNNDNKIKSAAGFSSLWDAVALKRVRRGDGVSQLNGRRVAMHLMLQPDIAAGFLSDRALIDQGLTSRMLVAFPNSTMGTRMYRDPTPESEAAFARYEQHMTQLLEQPIPIKSEDSRELSPRELRLADDARALLIGFSNEIERRLTPDGDLRSISGFANKLAEHAVRIAGVFTFVVTPSADIVEASTMASAIKLARWYASEARRLFDTGLIRNDLRQAELVRVWLLDVWAEDHISVPDLQQSGPNSIRDNAKARAIIATLESHGWLIPAEPTGATIRGKRRRDAWRVVRPARP
jgi:hypothetical protein